MSRRPILALALAGLISCAPADPPPPAPTATGAAPPAPPLGAATARAAPTVTSPPSPPLGGTPSPVPPTATAPLATATPDPVAGLTIADLRAASFGAGEIAVGEVWNRGAGYVSYRISYPADGLLLTGLLHVPDGAGPFPVIIANRGTIARDIYQPGMDSRAFADLMARNGYLVVAPDFRGYGGGEDGPNPFYTGLYRDVLALIPLAQQLPQARPGKLGMWGHSRGASVTIAALAVSDQIAAAAAYAPAPADLALDYERRFRQSGGNPGAATWPFPPSADPEAYRRVSPLYYLDAAGAPLQLHHGDADTTTDISASEQIAAELRRLGKPVALFAYPGQGHAFQGAAYELYAQRVLAFFQTHLGR